MKRFFSDTRAADTIPLKLVVYMGLLAAVLLLLAQAWQGASPLLEEAEVKAQVEDAALSLRSIQGGYARELEDSRSPEGSMCTLTFSLPPSVSYLSFGVDPDPDCNGNFSDSEWTLENNTLIYQYKNGIKNRILMEGETVRFAAGFPDKDGKWAPAKNPGNNETSPAPEAEGVVIEYPVSGEFVFELVYEDGKRYTMSHF
ncbi:hypothetical protein FTO70_05985 [Methanosarcina sp. KYL-1]|uniref:hypothetical protein n=1 Tax=Methanosarcina sp. KYL-1 TaxID=2602068 RepID=UPI002101CF43|nr:hypothetical protein [Methanosarcina sp. KYL-1]MCQ1535245.1 hypothetical protein [Methanosarcina sp. KYL-1]